AHARELLFEAVERHRVGALLHDEMRHEPGAVLRAIEHAGRRVGGDDVLAARARDRLAQVAAAAGETRPPFELEAFFGARGLRLTFALRTPARLRGDLVLDVLRDELLLRCGTRGTLLPGLFARGRSPHLA